MNKKENYSDQDIKVLDHITHIRLNPGMYISRTIDPCHLIEEAFDNSLDEAMANHANIIAIDLNLKENKYSIVDNGRGIPIDNDIPITVSTQMFSGAKFTDRKSAYGICSGLHGIGLVAIYALSDYYSVEVHRDNKYAKYEFEDAKLINKSIEKFKEDKPFSTKISFIPNKQYFENIIPDIDRIRQRILAASVDLPNVTFILFIDGKKEIIKLGQKDFFHKYCLSESDSVDDISNIIEINCFNKPEYFNIKFAYAFNSSIAPRFLSSVNILPVLDGGTHINIFLDILRNYLVLRGKKLDYKFQPNDITSGLRSYISLGLLKPAFSGQTKDKLINRREYFDEFNKLIEKEIEKYFNNNQDVLTSILEHIQQYRQNLDAKKIKNIISSNKRSSTKITKLRDCTSHNGELIITEGDSASGSFMQCRDPKIHAIFPLKGKIPSITNKKDILKNKEISELINILGTGIGNNFDINKLRYNKIICATDADEDGKHIFSLLTISLAVLAPELIKQGKYFLAVLPLYAINDKKIFKPIWTNEELEDAKYKNYHITRYKGLGEMNPNQLKICAIDEQTRKLKKIEYSTDINKLLTLFSSVDEKRNLINGTFKMGK